MRAPFVQLAASAVEGAHEDDAVCAVCAVCVCVAKWHLPPYPLSMAASGFGCLQVYDSEEQLAYSIEVRGPPQHGLSFKRMALITSDCGTMRSPSIKWP